jgi:hypothetical protein
MVEEMDSTSIEKAAVTFKASHQFGYSSEYSSLHQFARLHKVPCQFGHLAVVTF